MIRYVNGLKENKEQRVQGPINLNLGGVAKSVVYIQCLSKCLFLENTKSSFQKSIQDYNNFKIKQETLDEWFFEKKLNNGFDYIYEFF